MLVLMDFLARKFIPGVALANRTGFARLSSCAPVIVKGCSAALSILPILQPHDCYIRHDARSIPLGTCVQHFTQSSASSERQRRKKRQPRFSFVFGPPSHRASVGFGVYGIMHPPNRSEGSAQGERTTSLH